MAPRKTNPCSYLPRRLQIVSSLTVLVIVCIVFFGTTTYEVPYAENLQHTAQGAVSYLPKPKLPSVAQINPFKHHAHNPPPEQANSTSGDTKWYSDFKWMNPFSSSITLDENRAVLPPLRKRPPIYTYYDAEWDKDDEAKDATHHLLLIWRRAWWAQGFKPVVLGRPEAVNNPLYRKFQDRALPQDLENDLMRWLAWGNMGSGALANWLTLPMAPESDPLLSYLRRGEYPNLTRYEGLDSGLFTGSKDAINKAIDTALEMNPPMYDGKKSLIDILPKTALKVDPQHDGIAFYSTANIIKKYKGIADALMAKDTRTDGLVQLAQLITSHLHMTWQNTFTSGIAVLNPYPDHTTHLVKPAIDLARNLSQCTSSPYPASCPPNTDRCRPCVSTHSMLISRPPAFKNTTTLFTIGTVPHPYTFASLQHQTEALTLSFIRRKTARDTWIVASTRDLLGTGLSSFARLPHLKDAVASEFGSAHSLWLTAESTEDFATFSTDLAWIFGFPIPNSIPHDGRSETPVPGPERRPPPPQPEGRVPDEMELAAEKVLLEKSRMALKSRVEGVVRIKEIVEAWNLADTEIWRFARAWNARRRMERRKWEEEEEGFAGSEGGKGVWGRWFDRREEEGF